MDWADSISRERGRGVHRARETDPALAMDTDTNRERQREEGDHPQPQLKSGFTALQHAAFQPSSLSLSQSPMGPGAQAQGSGHRDPYYHTYPSPSPSPSSRPFYPSYSSSLLGSNVHAHADVDVSSNVNGNGTPSLNANAHANGSSNAHANASMGISFPPTNQFGTVPIGSIGSVPERGERGAGAGTGTGGYLRDESDRVLGMQVGQGVTGNGSGSGSYGPYAGGLGEGLGMGMGMGMGMGRMGFDTSSSYSGYYPHPSHPHSHLNSHPQPYAQQAQIPPHPHPHAHALGQGHAHSHSHSHAQGPTQRSIGFGTIALDRLEPDRIALGLGGLDPSLGYLGGAASGGERQGGVRAGMDGEGGWLGLDEDGERELGQGREEEGDADGRGSGLNSTATATTATTTTASASTPTTTTTTNLTRTRTRSKSKRRNDEARRSRSRPSARSGSVQKQPSSTGAGVGVGVGVGTASGTGLGTGGGEEEEEMIDEYGMRNGKRSRERVEEISTVFMVGFPDDITEREFTNIFTFANGFEAASLKFPNAPSVLSKESTSTIGFNSLPLAVQQQLGLSDDSVKTSGMASPVVRGEMDEEDSIYGGQMGNDPFRSSLPAATAAALGLGMNSTASSSTTSLVGMVNSSGRGPPRRQVIGFARFRTRADALVARETLQGRKVDVFSGATLKVEMAKKNLHSRRGFGSNSMSLAGVPESEIMDVLMRSGKLPGLLAGMGMGGLVLNRERSSGSQGRGRPSDGAIEGDERSVQSRNLGQRSGASTPSGKGMSMSDSFATLPGSLTLSERQQAAAALQQIGSQSRSGNIDHSTNQFDGQAESKTRSSFSSSQPAPPTAFSPRFAQLEMDQTPMNNKTYKHHRTDSLRSVFSTDWSNNPLPLSQVPEHPFSSSFGDRRSDEYLQPQLGSSMSGSNASGPPLSSSGSGSGMLSSDRPHGILNGSDQTSPAAGFTSPILSTIPRDSKALLALAEAEDEDWNVGGIGMEVLGSFDGDSRHNSPAPGRSSNGNQPNTFDGNASRQEDQPFVPRALTGLNGRRPMGSMTGPRSLSDFGVGSLNIADQNPPINTLYVGNLPSHLAVTQSPNYLEECLRNLFTRATGFKRMSFRQKVNGPMCFVEFDSVEFATNAIKELYGNTLGGLVKGGLRLSYSKNSLGQRGNGQPTRINTSQSVMTVSNMTSPGSYAAGGPSPLSPSASSNGLSFIPTFIPGRNNSGDSGLASSSFKSDTPLSPLAVPFNSSSLPHEMMVNVATSPRLQRFPSGGSEHRQGKDGMMVPISPRSGSSAPWPMTSISQNGGSMNNYASMLQTGNAQNGFSRS